MPQIVLDVPQATIDRLAKVAKDDAARCALARVALEEWAGWLSGEQRPTSMTELETSRILELYTSVLPDQLPSIDNLGKLFELPMGRARYIVQNLAYKKGRFLRERQLRNIQRALDVGVWNGGSCVLLVDRGCQLIIDRTLADLLADNKIMSVVTGVAVLDGVRYNLGTGHHRALTEEIKRQLDELAL